MIQKVAVIGAGGWGTALSVLLAVKGLDVTLWVRNSEVYNSILDSGENSRYLPGITVPDRVRPLRDQAQALKGKKMVIMAVPSHAMRLVAAEIAQHLDPEAVIVSAAKGLEEDSLLRMSEVLEEALPERYNNQIAVLSGPNHAEEVSRMLPAAAVAASRNESVASSVCDVLSTERFRIYTNTDLVGVETGGALKNVIALGAGIADGLELGDNAKAALIIRGIVEITRLGVALGAQAGTFSGLSGLGDLFVTCSSVHSRNRALGIRLGKGEPLEEILSGMNTVAEGVKTARAARRLAERHAVEMPITAEIYSVLFNDKPADEALEALMTRRSKSETEDTYF